MGLHKPVRILQEVQLLFKRAFERSISDVGDFFVRVLQGLYKGLGGRHLFLGHGLQSPRLLTLVSSVHPQGCKVLEDEPVSGAQGLRYRAQGFGVLGGSGFTAHGQGPSYSRSFQEWWRRLPGTATTAGTGTTFCTATSTTTATTATTTKRNRRRTTTTATATSTTTNSTCNGTETHLAFNEYQQIILSMGNSDKTMTTEIHSIRMQS